MAFDLLTYAKERKKEAVNSTQHTSEEQGRFDLMDYAMRRNAGNVANNISNRVNTWLKNHGTYVSNYKSRFSGRKGNLEDDYVSDSGDWLKTVTQQKDNFKAEAESILSYMDQYKDYLNADFVRSVRDTLISGTQQQRQIVNGSAKDNEWWESFNDQNKYGKYGSAEEGYKSEQRKTGYQKTYEGMTSEEISDVIAKLDDGEEREWLTAYKPLVEYDENSKLDTNALQSEIDAMEQVYKKAESIALNMGMGGEDSDAYMQNQIKDIIGKFSNGQYYTMEELEKAIAQKRQKLVNASRTQEGIKLSGVSDKTSEYYDPEFAKYTGYTGSTWIDGGLNRFLSWDKSAGMKTGYEDIRYDFINDPDAVTDYLSKSTVSSDFHLLSGLQAYRNMTEDQVATYNYYYAKHGKEAADKYLDSIQDSLNAKQGEKMAKPMYDKWLLQQVFGIAAGLDQFNSGLKNVFSNADYIPTSATQYASSYVRENLGENGGAFSQGVYDLITTSANMAPSILTSTIIGALNPAAGVVAGNALMGASAAGNAYQEVLNLGYGKEEARTYSTAIGVAEVALGSLLGGISKLGGLSPNIAKAVAGIDNGLLRFSLQYGGKMASEALEESLQEILDPILKNAILHADEDVNWSEVAYSALLGGLSAGVWEGVGTARQVVKEQKLKAEYGDNIAPLIQEGLESDVGTESYELATEYKAKTESGKSLTGAEIRQLLAANQDQIKPKDLKLIQQAAQKRLTDLGQTENVEQIAELATKFATGQKLSKEERSILARSEHGSKVSKDLLPENIWSEDTDTEWAEDIGTKVVNAAAYNKKKNLEKFEKVMEEVAKRAEETVNAEPATYKSLEERVGEDKTYAVAESGKATISGTDEEISLKNFIAKDVKANDMTIELENGKEVKASGIEYESGDQSYLFSAVPKIENITPAAATVAIKGYDSSSGMSVGEYLNGFDEGFTYGYWGYSEADLQSGNFAPKLGDTLMKTAYEMGKEARKSRKDTKTENIKKMRTAAQAEAEKAAAEGKKAPKAKNMTIVLDEGGGKVSDLKPNKKGLSDKQRAGVAMAKVLQKMGLGTNFEFYASYLSKTLKDEDGNPVRVFINENGVEEAAPAGVYRKSDGTIRIDLNAYNGHQMTLNAMAHELTHFIQQWSEEKYQVLVDFLMEAYEKTDMTMHQRVLREQARLKKIRKEEVSYREAYDEVVANAMSKMLDDGMVMERLAELRSKDAEVANKLVNKIRKLLNEFFNIFKKESALFWDAHDLMQMKDTFEKLQNIFAEALVEASDNFQAAQTIGFEMDMETESISPAVMRSEQTWTESDYVQQRDKAAQEIAKAIGVTEQKAKDYIDSINSIAKMIAEDRSRLDYFSSPGRSSFVDNAEYGGSFDFSTLCKKRRLLTGTFTAIQKALPNTALTADEILDIRNRMKEADLEVSCGLCYVEGSRANMGQFAKEFLRLYKQYYPDAWQPNMADVNTPDGIEWVRINHPECYEQYEYFWNHYGTLKEGDKNLFASQQKPKLYQLHTEYKGEILNKFKNDEKVEDKNINGGIRLQSFSDFEIVHLIDTMQIIMDMSRVGLAGQAYTKVPDFAWALGDTGLKINLSLIAKGVDANGKLIFDDVEGMPIAEAMKLRDRYSRNVGTILVAFNDEQLKAAMADDRVDFIIPFHRSQWKKSQYEAMGLPAKTKDYTFMQNEKYIKPQFHEYRGRMVKDKATNYMPNEYWDFTKSGKENAEAYLEMCARNNKRPKFYKLLQNNGDGSYSLKADGSTDGYWKLLIDFKMYDNEGNGSPQMAVKPDFNMEEANRMLNDYKGGHSQFPVAQGIVDDFVKDYKASHKGEMFSSQQTDRDKNKNRASNGSPLTRRSVKQRSVGSTHVENMSSTAAAEILGIENIADYSDDVKKAITVLGEFYTSVDKHLPVQGFVKTISASNLEGSLVAKNILKRGGLGGSAYRYDNGHALRMSNHSAKAENFKGDGEHLSLVLYEKGKLNDFEEATSNVIEAVFKYHYLDRNPEVLKSLIHDIAHFIAEGVYHDTAGAMHYNFSGTEAFKKKAEKRMEVDGAARKRRDEVRSTQETDNVSNRSLLANAFEGITQNSEEYKMIQEYRGHIKKLNELDGKLSDINSEIRDMLFGKGERDSAKLKKLEEEANEIAKEINRHDKRLLSLETAEPLRKVIARERKKEAQKTKEHVKEIQQNKKLRAEQTELRHKIRKTIRDLDKILNRGNKKQNVKEDVQPVVSTALKAADILFTDEYNDFDMLRNGLGVDLSDSEEALVKTCTQMLKDIDSMPDNGYDSWQKRIEAENKLKDKMSKLKDVFARERKRMSNTKVSSILGELADAYAKLQDSEYSYVQGAYIEAVHTFLKSLQTEVGGTIVMDMTKDQLEAVYTAYKMVLTTVRKANQMFNSELKLSREQLGNAVIEEVLKAGGVNLLGTKMGDKISQFDWNNMKPIWLANRIGSDTFGKLMKGLFEGQYNFAVDVAEARDFKQEMDEKYHPRKWDADKQYKFESSTGKEFSLNLQQIMSLYAFSKREQAYSHLLNGGFVFEENSTVIVDGKLGIKKTYIHKGATSYKLNEATLNEIINSLTPEQKAYVDDMQKYLSEVMGAKGNEVSMQLYGIQMFKEQFYFPLRSSGAYMEKAKEAEMKKQHGQINLVNSGFTHSVKPEAKNPIVLSGFLDVWAEHCNEMSMYHSMVLPMEDFRKVYNYTTVHDESMDSASVYQTIQDAYGKAATDYIDQLYRELNAGATVDPRETDFKAWISKFKKAAVMLSGSVVVQQFSAIGRAYYVIDPKYFVGSKVNSDTNLSAVEEMKKYAPIAIIKEMGGFDVGTKGSAKNYIMAEKYGKGERIKGFFKDEQYRGDIMGLAPAKADQATWCAIWEAAKRETKALHPKMDVKSDAFLKLAGQRFSEVIEKTQVYDSVLARSANMRSKGAFMTMATAFMAEPTTTINLLEDALRGRSGKQIARAFGSVAASIIINNALASIIYAMRDDDDDETFIEKYLQSFSSGMIDDVNPMTYYPFLKDIYSLFQGYDVERADMSVIADLRDAAKQAISLLGKDTSEMDDDELAEHRKNVTGVFMSLLDAACSALGVPLKNVRRDVKGIINSYKTIRKDITERDTTWTSLWDKIGEAAKDTVPVYAWTKDRAKSDKLYDAFIKGDKEYLSRLKSTYKDEKAYHSAVRTALRNNDPRIREAALAQISGDPSERVRIAKLIIADGFDQDDVVMAINAEINKLTEDDSSSGTAKAKGYYTAKDFVIEITNGDKASANAVRDDVIQTAITNGKTQKDAEKAFVSDAKSEAKKAYLDGKLSDKVAKDILLAIGEDEEEVTDLVSYWSFCKAHPKSDLTQSQVEKYKEWAEPDDIPLDVFEECMKRTAGIESIKDEWGDEVQSKMDQIIEIIDSLDLTWQQKDALYLAHGYAESKILDVPW